MLLSRAPASTGSSVSVSSRWTIAIDWMRAAVSSKARPSPPCGRPSIRQNTIAPGGTFGWHSHPGPSLVIVKSGTATFYMGDDPTCTPHVVTAGSGFVDGGGDVHVVRNEGTVDLVTIVTSLVPAGAARRIDVPDPGTSRFRDWRSSVPSYLVETYVPHSQADDIRSTARRARAIADTLSRAGTPVRYVRTTFLPDDETCFHVFEAVSEDAVSEVCRRAGL